MTGEKPEAMPDLTSTLESAKTLDSYLKDAIRALGPAKGMPMSSFAASLKAMIDDAKAGVEQARADGRAKVGEAVAKLNEAKVATTKVASAMAQAIADEADAAMSDLGQISNLPPE